MLNLLDYISNSRMFKKFNVDKLLFVEYKCLIKETEVGYWTHNNYFVYVVGGKKKWKTRDKEFVLENDQAIFIKKGAYAAHQYFEEDFCALFIFVTDEFIKSVVSKYAQEKAAKVKLDKKSDPIIPIKTDEALSAYFYSLLSYFPQQTSPSSKLLSLKFEELIINILTNPANSTLANYFWQIHSRSKISVSEIMETYFNYNMSLNEYAKLCGRSLSTFKNDFQLAYNMSPGKWLIQKRLDYGKFLLETTDKSILEIAFDSGFKNQSHFARIFKETFGKSPLHFRTSSN